ncbi:50S ribosomal protein L15 [Candidatus Falkowbacteria bacterium]|nr:50S ribosomal protein L15 [Candidatus Falkowbacteria bacterium]
MTLHTLKPAAGSTKQRKRVGRGNASGHGNYSCKGLKGQKSRSGVSGLKRMALKKALLQIPKLRGFQSDKPKYQVVNLSILSHNFADGAVISPDSLLKAGLVSQLKNIKLLANGQLKLKNLQIKGLKLSATAQEQITKLGGKIVE